MLISVSDRKEPGHCVQVTDTSIPHGQLKPIKDARFLIGGNFQKEACWDACRYHPYDPTACEWSRFEKECFAHKLRVDAGQEGVNTECLIFETNHQDSFVPKFSGYGCHQWTLEGYQLISQGIMRMKNVCEHDPGEQWLDSDKPGCEECNCCTKVYASRFECYRWTKEEYEYLD